MTSTCLVASLVVLCVVVFLWQSRNMWRSAAKISTFRLERTAILQREIDGLRQHLNESIRESDRVAKHNGDLQAKIAELESERRAYDLTVANCDHLRVENERLEKQLEAMGIKPAAVLAAEHDNVGAIEE